MPPPPPLANANAANTCALGKLGCNGIPRPGTQRNSRRNQTYQGFRCTGCSRFRAAKNALIDGEIRGARNSGEFRSFFATANEAGKSQTKMSIQKALVILHCWARDLSLKQTREMIDTYGFFAIISYFQKIFAFQDVEDHTLVDWRNFIREVCLRALQNAPAMGGLGTICAIDESLLRGRRKYNRGRLLRGNRMPLARHNYGRIVAGPWIFGMVIRRDDGMQDLRMFHVLRRNKRTLRPIVLRNLLPGSNFL